MLQDVISLLPWPINAARVMACDIATCLESTDRIPTDHLDRNREWTLKVDEMLRLCVHRVAHKPRRQVGEPIFLTPIIETQHAEQASSIEKFRRNVLSQGVKC